MAGKSAMRATKRTVTAREMTERVVAWVGQLARETWLNRYQLGRELLGALIAGFPTLLVCLFEYHLNPLLAGVAAAPVGFVTLETFRWVFTSRRKRRPTTRRTTR